MIDWARIHDLYEEIGEDAFAEVLDLFVQDVNEGLARLRAASDAKARSAEFHFLKGAALNLGLGQLAATCALGETNAAQGQDTTAAQADIETQFPRVNATLLRDWRQRLCA